MNASKHDIFLKKAKEVADAIKEETKNNGQIKIISHLDTDGIAAAGIIVSALYRAKKTRNSIIVLKQTRTQLKKIN